MTVTVPARITIVVPVYNGATTLASCLCSVEQTVCVLSPSQRERVEVVICDNHSTDDSVQIARAARFACAARVIQPPAHLPNRTDNWHYGLSAASGDWLIMLHADDGLLEGALPAWFRAIAHPLAAEVGFMTGRHRMFVDSLDELGAPHPRLAPVIALLPGRLLVRWALPLQCPFVHCSVLIRREAYDDVGGLDSSRELTQDWDLWIRLCRRYDVLHVPFQVAAFRSHPTSPGYQRVNMAEHVAVQQELGSDPSLPIRWLARRSMHARVTKVLSTDDTEEAQPIRERAAEFAGQRQRGSECWMQAAAVVFSATLYGLRASGAVRAAMSSRGISTTSARAT